MSATRTLAFSNLKNLHPLTPRVSKVYPLYPYHCLKISTSQYGLKFLENQGLPLNLCSRIRGESDTKKGVTVHSGVQPGPPGPSSSWVYWILGSLIAVILPFWKLKAYSLSDLIRGVDKAVETIDTAAEVLETVAEGVEKVTDEVGDQLPEGGKLKDTLEFVEHVAKNVADDAQATDELIHKVENVEKEVETLTETVIEQENAGTKEIRKEE